MNEKIQGIYLHCSTCVRQNKGSDDIEVLSDGLTVQIWCRTHAMQVVLLVLNKPLFDGKPKCGHDDHGREN